MIRICLARATFILFLVLGLIGGRPLAAQPLVDAAWLKDRLGQDNLVVLDVTSPRFYARGHIPGAVFTSFGKWRVRKGDVAGMLPPAEYLEKLIGNLGIGNDDHVVIVPGGFSASEFAKATRTYWTFLTLGHDKVSVLDGGMRAWLRDRRNPVQQRPNSPEPAKFTAKMTTRWLATAKDVEKALADGSAVLVDNRPTAQHLGVTKSGSVVKYGTIPGAINVPEEWLTVKGGVVRPRAQLARLHELLKVGDGPTIHFCNTGHRASLGWFVRSQVLGHKDAKLYDGSMAEWTRLPPRTHPVIVRLDIRGQ